MSSCRISIVTATLNALRGLKQTVSSVRQQSFHDYEHIVVDGGSEDGTIDWLERQPSIIWTSRSDSGIGDAMNRGVQMASGDWILVMHSEDTFNSETSLEEAAESLDPAVDAVCFDVDFVTSQGTRRLSSRGFSPRLNFKPFPHQGALTAMGLFKEVGLFDTELRFHPDYDLYLRAYRAGATSATPGSVLTNMPDTGISSRRDWGSLRARFAEEKLIHERYVGGTKLGLVYSVYWSLYPAYRHMRFLTESVMA